MGHDPDGGKGLCEIRADDAIIGFAACELFGEHPRAGHQGMIGIVDDLRRPPHGLEHLGICMVRAANDADLLADAGGEHRAWLALTAGPPGARAVMPSGKDTAMMFG